MARIGIYLPGSMSIQEMADAVRGYQHMEPMFIEQLPNADVVRHAEKAVAEGCDLFIARGLQGEMLHQQLKVSVPIVPLSLTAQEVAVLIYQIMHEVHLDHRLRIRLIGYANMFPDVTHFSELFGADIQTLLVGAGDNIRELMIKANNEGVDVIIGGRHCCALARELGIPAYFAKGGSEGLHHALILAEQMCEVIDTKRRSSAEAEAIVENNFNGILHIDNTCRIINANRVMQGILQKDQHELSGRTVTAVLPGFDTQVLQDTIEKGKETYSLMYRYNQTVYAVNIAPIRLAETICGAYLTFQEGRTIRRLNSDLRREMLQKGFVANQHLEDVNYASAIMLENVTRARKAASHHVPILLSGPQGVERDFFARGIHNASMVAENPFVSVDCTAYPPEKMDEYLFGREDPSLSMVEAAQEGTLYLRNIDSLSLESQNKLISIIASGCYRTFQGTNVEADMRIIASTSKDLQALSAKEQFSTELLYALSVVTISLPPLEQRPEDIPVLFNVCLKHWQKIYNRYIRLTSGAYKTLQEYSWPGNVPQILQVSQRVVLTCERREANEMFIRRQLEQTFAIHFDDEKTHIVTSQDKKVYEITRLLEKYQGSREQVAREMGISKTTLWRYMKKYNIGSPKNTD